MEPLTDSWRECPGGRGVNVNLRRAEADCPECGTTFATMADDPTFPRHYVSLDGKVVTFRG
jgi:hypothetical protein